MIIDVMKKHLGKDFPISSVYRWTKIFFLEQIDISSRRIFSLDGYCQFEIAFESCVDILVVNQSWRSESILFLSQTWLYEYWGKWNLLLNWLLIISTLIEKKTNEYFREIFRLRALEILKRIFLLRTVIRIFMEIYPNNILQHFNVPLK